MITLDQSRGLRRGMVALAILGGLSLVLGVAALLVLSNFGSANIHAFVTPSNSMCPTICEGERFFVDLAAYSTHAPARGDVIAFDYQSEGKGSLFIKRVIGIAGDTVSSDSSGEILVNGRALSLASEKSICGKPTRGPDRITEPLLFPSTTVPQGALFLVGDNLANSFDSRFPNFGAAPSDRARGKLMLIYWSPGSGRIGCSIR